MLEGFSSEYMYPHFYIGKSYLNLQQQLYTHALMHIALIMGMAMGRSAFARDSISSEVKLNFSQVKKNSGEPEYLFQRIGS